MQDGATVTSMQYMRSSFADSGILLRRLEPGDAASFHAAARESVDSVGRWMSWCHADYSMREVAEWFATCEKNWAAGADRDFGIFDAGSNEVLGCAGINQINRVHNFANLGYWVRASRANRGVATTTVRLLAGFAFGELKLARIEIVVRVDNIPSRRVAEKVGCKFECIARNRLLFKDRSYDAALYSLIPSDIGA